MALKSILLTTLLVLNCPAAVLCRATHHYWKGFSKVETLFVFGDSYSRTGFNPSSSSQPSRGNPLGNPAYPGVTSANGPNWVDYLTTTYNKSSLLTYNFGTSGAVVAASIVNANGHDLHQEVVEYFQPRYKVGKTFHASTSLFVTWFGINDIMHGNLSGRPDTVKKLFEAYGQDIGRLYKSGARNFLLMTVPPVERAPRITNQKDPSARIRSVKEAVETWNSHVKELAKHIETVYPKSTAFVFDTYPLFSKVIEKPSAFKETKIYKDTTTYCSAYKKGTAEPNTKSTACKYAADQYLWLNNLHPTFPMHKLLAKHVSSFLKAQ